MLVDFNPLWTDQVVGILYVENHSTKKDVIVGAFEATEIGYTGCMYTTRHKWEHGRVREMHRKLSQFRVGVKESGLAFVGQICGRRCQ